MVNVIIPTYKARGTLPDALNSLLVQTKKLFTVTIVQDCDGEDYTDIVDDFRSRGLSLNLLQTPKNGGPGCARQYGMDHDSMSEYFMFLDADDIMMPRAVEVLSREAGINKADVISSDFLVEKRNTPGFIMEAKSAPCTWTHGKIYRAKFLRDNNIRFLDDLRLNEDSYFNLVVCNSTKNKFVVSETTYLWKENPDSLTRKREEGQKVFFSKSWEMYVRSQAEGLLKIEEITHEVDPELLAMTLINVYSHMMRATYFGFKMDKAAAYLKKLKGSNSIQEQINTETFWRTIASSLKPCYLSDDNELIFFQEIFPEWLNKYVKKN